MTDWIDTVPVLDRFELLAEPEQYVPVPDDWWIGVSDVVDSGGAIEAGRYKAVNLAGAGTISAVSNALEGSLRLFVFGGDGARFVVPPQEKEAAADAMARVAMWARRDLGLDLRVGMARVADARAAGFDIRVAFWQASPHVRYAMFMGGGQEWADRRLKASAIAIPPAPAGQEPDLTGLSCQWGPVRSAHGTILSLILKPGREGSAESFTEVAGAVMAVLEEGASISPMPASGPEVRWPSGTIALQSRVATGQGPRWWRRIKVGFMSAVYWLVFKLGLPLGGFRPDRYRREISENTDFRKFDDGLLMTVDCSSETIARLQKILEDARAQGRIRYGLHKQDEALVTCVVPAVLTSEHMHFIDGAQGGYAMAARQMRP